MNSRKKTLQMMPFYPRDYIAGTRGMTPAERGVYFDLLCLEWDAGGPLPKELTRLAAMVGVSNKRFRSLWRSIKNKFEHVPTGIINARLEDERNKALKRYAKTSEKASNAAVARWQQRSSPDAPSNAPSIHPQMLEASVKQCLGDAIHIQSPQPSGDKDPTQPFPQSGKGGRRATHSNPRARATNPRANGTNARALQNRSLEAWHEATTLIGQVIGRMDRTWLYVRDQCIDKLTFAAAEAVGCKAIAERDKFNTKELQARFRNEYERLVAQQESGR